MGKSGKGQYQVGDSFYTLEELATRSGIPAKTISNRIYRLGQSAEKAISYPVNQHPLKPQSPWSSNSKSMNYFKYTGKKTR